MSKHALTTPDTLPTSRFQAEPKNMVFLRAANKELFLLDINCALVSRRCRRLLKGERLNNDGEQVSAQEVASHENSSKISVFASEQEEKLGSVAYPVIHFPDVASDVLDLAIGFMYSKYRLDMDPEKQLAPQAKWNASSNVKLIAASVLLEM